MIQVTLKDGSKKEYRKGITIKEVAQDISAGLTRLRKKLAEAGLEDFIVTKKGMGYMVK